MKRRRGESFVFGSAALIAGVVLACDLYVELGVDIPVLYVVAVGVLLFTRRSWLVIAAAIGCTILTLAGLFVSPPGSVLIWHAAANRVVAITAIWLTTALGIKILSLLEEQTRRADQAEDAADEFAHERDEEHRRLCDLASVMEDLRVERRKLARSEEQLRNLADELEHRVERRTSQLAEANRALEQSNLELQQFAYIASHDLQTPLRAIVNFAQFLETEYADQLDADARNYIKRIVAGTKRMRRMIDDLLEFSRVESRSVPFESVDLGNLCDDAVEVLDASVRDSRGEVTRDPLPAVLGDAAQLSQLFQNLIGNALKYHGGTPPDVRISSKWHDGRWTIAVRDNGIGIAPEHHNKVFEIFRRLHTEREYPGSGIGLGICRRIVHRHGGEIWLESQPGAGSTFYFTLRPANQAADAISPANHGKKQRQAG